MTSATRPEIIVGLDLGSTKVSAVVGEVDADGITILGVGNVPCRGLRKGVVSNIDWTVRSIREAVDAAETMAGVEIQTVYAGVAGAHSQGPRRTDAPLVRADDAAPGGPRHPDDRRTGQAARRVEG